jgi:hypothetical protein
MIVMKKKSLKLRWPYFFGQRIHGLLSSGSGNMPELIKPESEWQRAESGIEDLLRWADDGGKMLDLENRTTVSSPDAAREQ